MRTVLSIMTFLMLVSCDKQQAAQKEPDYGYIEEEHGTKLYKCLDKDCNEKKLMAWTVGSWLKTEKKSNTREIE